MARVKTRYRCEDCGIEVSGWSGRCPACGAWNTVTEVPASPYSGPPAGTVGGRPVAVELGAVDVTDSRPRATGVGELDRVLGGGLVPRSVTLVGGEPGIGKSTLILQAVAGFAAAGRSPEAGEQVVGGQGRAVGGQGRAVGGQGGALVVAAEESAQQVKRRAQRLDVPDAGVWVLAETELPAITAAVAEVRPELLVVDSIQTVRDPEVPSGPGSVTQVRGCAQALAELAKAAGLAVLLVGHVTKDGSLAGPRALEHVVDTVLSFEGDRHQSLRLLRAVKHRFGATGELGVFEMTDRGLRGVPEAGGRFLADRHPGASGSAVFPALEGQRPLLVELQALVAPSTLGTPRRSVSGLDGGRLALLVAVLDRRVGVKLGGSDLYASVVGGIRVAEPGADLAVCLALVSSALGWSLPDDLVAVGEVGLAGELRQVGHLSRRLAEAERLGFRRALLPASAEVSGGAMVILRAATVGEAIDLIFGGRPDAVEARERPRPARNPPGSAGERPAIEGPLAVLSGA